MKFNKVIMVLILLHDNWQYYGYCQRRISPNNRNEVLWSVKWLTQLNNHSGWTEWRESENLKYVNVEVFLRT